MPTTPTEILQAAIARRTAELPETLPAYRPAAIQALVSAIDRQPCQMPAPTIPDPLTGIPVSGLGNSRALQLVLASPVGNNQSPSDIDAWATSFLDACQQLARADLVHAHAETGFLRLQVSDQAQLEARIAQGNPPLRWLERADDAWWKAWLEVHHPLPDGPPLPRARAQVCRLALRYDLPVQGVIGGVDLELVRTLLTHLLAMPADAPLDAEALVQALAEKSGSARADVSAALDALTLDTTSAAWHAAVPGITDPPLIRLPDDRLLISRRGVGHDPFRFVTRELRRRDPASYHATAAHRETSFRTDLYTLFAHRRFVTSSGSVELRREQGTIRTDIDAAIFDRKSGTLALFELKTNEPFARSTAELVRTQENTRAAGRQVSNILDWINRHGANEILNRLDRQTAKNFRVQKVQAFVLGRHLIDGTEKRAVWATWPQFLRVLGNDAVEDLGANPIMILAGRLGRDQPLVSPRDVREPVLIDLGVRSLVVRPLR